MFREALSGLALRLGIHVFMRERALLLAELARQKESAQLLEWRRLARERTAKQWEQYGSVPFKVALDLLISKLRRDQLAQLALTGSFLVRGSEGGYYEVRGHIVYLLHRTSKGWSRAIRFCMGPSVTDPLPIPDVALGHLLYLVTNEHRWRREAVPSDLTSYPLSYLPDAIKSPLEGMLT